MLRNTRYMPALTALIVVVGLCVGCGQKGEPYTTPDYTPDASSEGEAAVTSKPQGEAPAAVSVAELALDVDPFCGMSLAGHEVTVTAEYEGKKYGFCCTHCRDQFMADPGGRLEIHAKRQEKAAEVQGAAQ